MAQLGYPPARINLLTAIKGDSFTDGCHKRLEAVVSKTSLPIADLGSLMTNQQASGRLKCLADMAWWGGIKTQPPAESGN
jgi:hypothetical protein